MSRCADACRVCGGIASTGIGCGDPDPTRENTSPEGKASAVQFVKFAFASDLISRFKAPGAQIVVGIDHPNYAHMAVLSEPIRAALAEDFD